MTPSSRTTHQRDRRFARVRMLTRTIFVGSSVLSVGMVGYLSSVTKLHTSTHPVATTTVPKVTTTTSASTPAGSTGSAAATTTTTVPVTTTTTCYTSPSGNTVCN